MNVTKNSIDGKPANEIRYESGGSIVFSYFGKVSNWFCSATGSKVAVFSEKLEHHRYEKNGLDYILKAKNDFFVLFVSIVSYEGIEI